MKMSDQIQELAAALAKAQGEISHASKDAVNPHFGKSYADLASVWEAIRLPLSKNGLSVVQTFDESKAPAIVVETTLLHSSGQFITTGLQIMTDKNTAHGVGSAITYARRYSLQSVVGVAPDDDKTQDGGRTDDDGNAASGIRAVKPKPEPQQTARAGNEHRVSLKVSTVAAPGIGPAPVVGPSEAQLKRLFAIAKANDVTHDEIKAWLNERGVASSKDMTRAMYDDICQQMTVGMKQNDRPAETKVDQSEFNDFNVAGNGYHVRPD